jgi:hypothetical protein
MPWLSRSGQVWKLRWSLALTWIAVALLLLQVVATSRSGPWPFVIAMPCGIASFALVLLVRCRVCGLQIQTSSVVRALPWYKQRSFMNVLEACPVCGDAGDASEESRHAWSETRGRPEPPYWQPWRLVLVIVAILGLFVTLLLIPWHL